MDNKKKIEIPFGAFDSELMRQEIFIPEGFEATIEGDKIILTRIESEDERIRKELIKYLKEGVEGYMPAGDRSDYQRWLAWLEKQGEQSICNIPSKEIILAIWDLGNEWKELTNNSISTEYGTQLEYIQKHWNESEYYLREKQGEQKPIDKVEPKFKVGNWVTNGRYTKLIVGINSDWPYYMFEDGTSERIKDIDKKYHLWTTKDSKEGEILSTEQRDYLFAKIKDAGYEWDADKKRLKEIKKTSKWEWLKSLKKRL